MYKSIFENIPICLFDVKFTRKANWKEIFSMWLSMPGWCLGDNNTTGLALSKKCILLQRDPLRPVLMRLLSDLLPMITWFILFGCVVTANTANVFLYFIPATDSVLLTKRYQFNIFSSCKFIIMCWSWNICSFLRLTTAEDKSLLPCEDGIFACWHCFPVQCGTCTLNTKTFYCFPSKIFWKPISSTSHWWWSWSTIKLG
jgi:hypothetical protein